METNTATDFFRAARTEVDDLYAPNPRIFWADFLVTMTIAYSASLVFIVTVPWSMLQISAFLVAGPALYRLATFIHEIAHFRKNEMKSFRRTWDILVGIPMMMPSHFYTSHLDHHNTNVYGTEDDGEYLPLGRGPLHDIAVFMSQVFLQPLMVIGRFLFLTPISYLHPMLRSWTLERASSLVIDLKYRFRRRHKTGQFGRDLLEFACCLRAWWIFAAVAIGLQSWAFPFQLYLLAIYSLGLNHIRTLAAHRFLNEGARMSREQQLMDSTNIVGGNWLSPLLFPIGTRFHALHHLFPRIPYHNLRQAHERLMDRLPQDSVYRETVYPNWTSVVKELFENSLSSQTAIESPQPYGTRKLGV